MAINNISQNRLVGEMSDPKLVSQDTSKMTIDHIVGSIKKDISHIKDKMENLPPFPDSKWYYLFTSFANVDTKPMTPLARFQNHVINLEDHLISKTGVGNAMVHPQTEKRHKTVNFEMKPTAMERI